MFEEKNNSNETPEPSEQEGEELSDNSEGEVKKIRIMGASKDANFGGSTIIKTEDEKGMIIGYAIRKNAEGELEGNKIGYMLDGSIGTTYQLHDSDFENLKQMGVLDSYEGALANESLEKINEAKISMLRLYNEGDKFNPWSGTWPSNELMSPAEKALEGMGQKDQEQVASDFFDATIGRSILNNKNAYMAYGLFSKTPFGQKFRQLEDDRLKAAGFSAGFTL